MSMAINMTSWDHHKAQKSSKGKDRILPITTVCDFVISVGSLD